MHTVTQRALRDAGRLSLSKIIAVKSVDFEQLN